MHHHSSYCKYEYDTKFGFVTDDVHVVGNLQLECFPINLRNALQEEDISIKLPSGNSPMLWVSGRLNRDEWVNTFKRPVTLVMAGLSTDSL